MSFSVNPTSRSGGRTLGRTRVSGRKSSMKRTVYDQPFSAGSVDLGRTTSPPAWLILFAAFSEHWATIILIGCVMLPLPRSFVNPISPRLISNLLPDCFAFPCSTKRSRPRLRSPTLIALSSCGFTGTKPVFPISQPYRITLLHRCRFQPAFPCPPCIPLSLCWPDRPQP